MTATSFVILWLSLFNPVRSFSSDLQPGSEECFYQQVNNIHEKIITSFEVIDDTPSEKAGGISFKVQGPNGKVFLDSQNKLGETSSVQPEIAGVHSFCFSNARETTTIAFMIELEEDEQYKNIVLKEHLSPLESSVVHLSDQFAELEQKQRNMRVRERVHRKTTESTRSRVFWWSCIETAVLLSMSVWQVYYLRQFFEVKRMI